jgi:hypothetical protein
MDKKKFDQNVISKCPHGCGYVGKFFFQFWKKEVYISCPKCQQEIDEKNCILPIFQAASSSFLS